MASAEERIRILIADDHAIVLEGVVSVVSADPECTVVATTSSGKQAVELYRQYEPDIAVVDLMMPDMDGVQVITAIRTTHPQAKIIVLTSNNGEDSIYQAIQAGAMSYLLKETAPDSLLETIKAVHQGKRVLSNEIALKYVERTSKPMFSERELEVLAMLSQGKSNGEIGAQFSLTEGTVKVHVHNILEKLGVHDRTSAVVLALKRGIIKL